MIFKSLFGSCPLTIPATVVTPTTDTALLLIETIFDTIGSCEMDKSLYCRRFPTLTLFENVGSELVIVLTPLSMPETVATPSAPPT